MSLESKHKYLTEVLSQQTEAFGSKRKQNKRRAFWFKMLVTSFSVATTILLGLQGLDRIEFINGPVLLKNLALVLSALVTLLSVWDAFFNHRALWVRYTKTVTQLRGIASELEYLSSGGTEALKEEDVDRLYQKYESVLEDTNSFWLTLRDENALKKEDCAVENDPH